MSLKQYLAEFLKHNRFVYSIYYYSASSILRLIGLFCVVDDRLVLFNSYAGRSYGDSPKAIFERMKKDSRFDGYRIVWAFHDPDKQVVEGASIIKTDTLQYFLTALRARIWVTNSSVERGLSFKNAGTIYINTWHGTPIKKMGSDLGKDSKAFNSKGAAAFDAMCVQGEYEAAIWSRVFSIQDEKLIRTGLPRNDELAVPCEKRRQVIREKLGIPENKLAILYCPTYREYDYHINQKEGQNKPPLDMVQLGSDLSNDYILLIRAHYAITKYIEIDNDFFVKNVTDYPDLNELIIASDLLISDYSSIFFDYSITGKPMIHYTYDYDVYSFERGLYFDIREWLNGGSTQEELTNILLNLDIKEESKRSESFRKAYITYYGDASQGVLDKIQQLMS